MKQPTKKQLARMLWGYKFVNVDLTTTNKGQTFRYRLGEWATSDPKGRAYSNDECPRFYGDGLCVASTLQAAQSGGTRLGHSICLLVGYLPEDVLHAGHKTRVSRMYVLPDPVDPKPLLIRPRADLSGADLSGADLSGADLSGADLYRADLSRADLSGADLYRANLSRADLSRANLSRANLSGADLSGAKNICPEFLPAGWKIRPSGLIERA